MLTAVIGQVLKLSTLSWWIIGF